MIATRAMRALRSTISLSALTRASSCFSRLAPSPEINFAMRSISARVAGSWRREIASPWRNAFWLARVLLAADLGPVLLAALRRLAARFVSEVMTVPRRLAGLTCLIETSGALHRDRPAAARSASRRAISLRTHARIRAIRSTSDSSRADATRCCCDGCKPPSPTAVEGSIAGVTSIAEAVDTSEDSCRSDEFGTSKNCGDDADFVVSPTVVERSTTGATSIVEPIAPSDESCGSGRFGASKCCGDDADLDVSPTAMESSIAGAAATAEAVDTSDDPCAAGESGGPKSCVDRTDINVSVTDAPGVSGWIDDSRPEVVSGAGSLRCSTAKTSPL